MTKPDQISTIILPLLQVRRYMYDLLRNAFLKEPTKSFLLNVKEDINTSELPFVNEHVSIERGVNLIKHYLSHNDIQSERVQSDLHWEFTRLFIGPYELPAPPWESVFCNEDRLLFQEVTLEVRKAYLKYSLLPVEFGQEADDHLGLELDFMFRLTDLAIAEVTQEEPKDLYEILMDQKLFLEKHLLKWVPSLSEAIINNAKTEFYQGMANLLVGFLELDLRALQELLDIES